MQVARFTASITVTPLADGRSWVMYSPDFALLLGDGDEIEVPPGFVTDFASVPRPLWWLFAPWGRHGHAAVIHDWGYYAQDRSRRDYDRIFLQGMQTLGVGWLQRHAMWLAVAGPACFRGGGTRDGRVAAPGGRWLRAKFLHPPTSERRRPPTGWLYA